MTSNPLETREYTLFIDESGRFGERELAEERHGGDPSSQICGIILPGSFEHRQRGQDLPTALLELFPLGQEDHAVDIRHEERAVMIEQILKRCATRDWRLTRLVNNSGVGEGEVSVTYTRMVAELIVCLYQTLSEEDPTTRPVIHLTYANVLLGKRINGRSYYFSRNEVTPELRYQGQPIMIEPLEYSEAIKRELIIDLKHGMGLDEAISRQALGKVRAASARTHPALRLSDLVSNCTYKRGRALRNFGATRALLLDAIEPYDYELHPLKSAHLAEDLARHRALGQAIISVLENLKRGRLSREAHAHLRTVLSELIEDLAREHSAERASDLRAILDAVEDWVQRLRNYSTAEELIALIQAELLPPLQANGIGDEELAWFRFRLLNLALANANHNGQLELSQARRVELEQLRTVINHRWEELSTIMSAQLNIASSYANTLEFEAGFSIAEEVCGFYQDMTEMLGAFRGESLISPNLKIDAQGYARGVALMLERYVCLERLAQRAPIDDQLKRGRELGQEALSTLSNPEDKMRIYQQLAHLEALDHNFEDAWRLLWLGVSGGEVNGEAYRQRAQADVTSGGGGEGSWRHGCLKALEEMPDLAARFPLFHLLRLTSLEVGSAQGGSQDRRASNDSLSDFCRHLVGLIREKAKPILAGQLDDYPAHAILRSWSTLNARLGDDASAIGGIRSLCQLLDQYGGGDALQLVTLSAIAECAVALAESGKVSRGVQLITGEHKRGSRGAHKSSKHDLSSRLKTVRTQVKEIPPLLEWVDELREISERWVKAPEESSLCEALSRHASRYPG